LLLTTGLELALRQTLGLSDSAGGIGGPAVVFAFVACIASFGPAVAVLWVAFIGGLLIDLTWSVALWAGGGQAVGQVTFVGPHALGFVAGAWAILNCRRIFVRRIPLAVAVLAVLGAVVMHVVALILLLVRDAIDPAVALPAQGFARIIGAFYTALPALLIASCLRWLLPLLGLPDPYDKRTMYGRGT
ncbi:MAG TPA: hypothetical protein VFF65_13540, partial [Phycisphaerales bacterium]|nr:hypothetical protein [Phycisphaerales bacterium]